MTVAPAMHLDEVAILLDVDGTLLDIAATPHEVRVPPSLRRTLQQLLVQTDGALALVSGRPLADLDRIFAPLRLPAVGGHGAEIRRFAHGRVERREAAGLDERLKRRLAAVAAVSPGILVEDKGYSIALHFRQAPQAEMAVRDGVAAICAELPVGIVDVLPGKAVIEIKPAAFDKGTGVRELMRLAPFAGRRPVFVGDDITDDAAFAALPELDGIGVSVGRAVPGVASRLETPEDVRRWLARTASEKRMTIP